MAALLYLFFAVNSLKKEVSANGKSFQQRFPQAVAMDITDLYKVARASTWLEKKAG